jgi:hypothetical protein
MNHWSVWRTIGELAHRDAVIARALEIVGHDYRGISPSPASLWWQVSDTHTLLLGVKTAPREYRVLP